MTKKATNQTEKPLEPYKVLIEKRQLLNEKVQDVKNTEEEIKNLVFDETYFPVGQWFVYIECNGDHTKTYIMRLNHDSYIAYKPLIEGEIYQTVDSFVVNPIKGRITTECIAKSFQKVDKIIKVINKKDFQIPDREIASKCLINELSKCESFKRKKNEITENITNCEKSITSLYEHFGLKPSDLDKDNGYDYELDR